MIIRPTFLLRTFPALHEKQDTVEFVKRIKRDALVSKRACGQSCNPFKPVPGMEKEFEEAAKTITYCDRILKDMAKIRERRKKKIMSFAKGVNNNVLYITLGIAATGIITSSLARFCITFHMHPIYLFICVVIVAIAIELWKIRCSRK